MSDMSNCKNCGHPEVAHSKGELKCWIGHHCSCAGFEAGYLAAQAEAQPEGDERDEVDGLKPCGFVEYIGRLKAEVERLKAERGLLRIALADAIRRPLGVEPYSAYGLIGQPEIDAAEERLVCTNDECKQCRATDDFVDQARQALSEK